MPELPILPAGVESALRVVLIALATLVAFFAFRAAVGISGRTRLRAASFEQLAGRAHRRR